VVGYDIVDNILGDGDPIGKEIRVDGVPYTIVGVGERQGKTFGQSQDNWVACRSPRISTPTAPTIR
jgi:putative ABC transport system permease protein